jgi:hypothetical protein
MLWLWRRVPNVGTRQFVKFRGSSSLISKYSDYCVDSARLGRDGTPTHVLWLAYGPLRSCIREMLRRRDEDTWDLRNGKTNEMKGEGGGGLRSSCAEMFYGQLDPPVSTGLTHVVAVHACKFEAISVPTTRTTRPSLRQNNNV